MYALHCFIEFKINPHVFVVAKFYCRERRVV